MSCDDEGLITCIEAGNEYLQASERLRTHLSSGFFSLALSRKSKSISVEQCRLEMDPVVTCREDGSLEMQQETLVEPLLMLSALPPPALRSAQKEFLAALTEVTSMALLAQTMLSKTPVPP